MAKAGLDWQVGNLGKAWSVWSACLALSLALGRLSSVSVHLYKTLYYWSVRWLFVNAFSRLFYASCVGRERGAIRDMGRHQSSSPSFLRLAFAKSYRRKAHNPQSHEPITESPQQRDGSERVCTDLPSQRVLLSASPAKSVPAACPSFVSSECR